MANRHGKPVITATEMLQSMIDKPRATRAEISDVANAIFDNTDAIMLSNESAVGKYPVKATLTLSKVAASIEHEQKKHAQLQPPKLFEENQPISYATCEAAADMAKNIGAKMIVAITMSGFTAQHIAKHRPFIPIVAITEDKKVQYQLQLVWGIDHVFVRKIDFKNYVPLVRKLLIEKKLVHVHDHVVVICNASKEEKLISTIII
jgi:pyruvate kinase